MHTFIHDETTQNIEDEDQRPNDDHTYVICSLLTPQTSLIATSSSCASESNFSLAMSCATVEGQTMDDGFVLGW